MNPRYARRNDDSVPPAADAGPRQPELGTCYYNSSEHTRDTHGPKFPCQKWVPAVPQEAASSNSITVARESFTQTETQELTKCPTCHGYHIGGCHRATAPDWAMRVARLLHKSKCRACEAGEEIDAYCYKGILADAALIREAGSERERVEPKSLWGWPIDEIKSAMRQWQSKHGSKLPTEFEHECREASRLLGRESK